MKVSPLLPLEERSKFRPVSIALTMETPEDVEKIYGLFDTPIVNAVLVRGSDKGVLIGYKISKAIADSIKMTHQEGEIDFNRASARVKQTFEKYGK